MKAILISIRPEWVEKILNGEKTIEIRKTMPNCELPCKVYIYCTKARKWFFDSPFTMFSYELLWKQDDKIYNGKEDSLWNPEFNHYDILNGKVIAEFTLNKVEDFSKWEYDFGSLVRHLDLYAGTNGNYPFLIDYLKGNKKGYAWHIDNLKIYDTPKELSEFSHYIPNNDCPKKQCGINCEDCMSYDSEHETCLELWHLHREIKRPPQSWFYVQELEEV